MFTCAMCDVPGGATLLRIRSMIVAHIGCVGVKLRYNFSHIMSIASFLALMFNRLKPPSFMGRYRKSRAILGDESSFHMKFHVILIRAFLIDDGMPWALVRNWVRPPMTTCAMIFLP